MIDIVIRDRFDQQGHQKTEFTAGRMSYEEMFDLGPVIGKIVASYTNDKVTAMTVLNTIYNYAGRQLAFEYGDYTDEEMEIAERLRDDYVADQDRLGQFGFKEFEKSDAWINEL